MATSNTKNKLLALTLVVGEFAAASGGLCVNLIGRVTAGLAAVAPIAAVLATAKLSRAQTPVISCSATTAPADYQASNLKTFLAKLETNLISPQSPNFPGSVRVHLDYSVNAASGPIQHGFDLGTANNMAGAFGWVSATPLLDTSVSRQAAISNSSPQVTIIRIVLTDTSTFNQVVFDGKNVTLFDSSGQLLASFLQTEVVPFNPALVSPPAIIPGTSVPSGAGYQLTAQKYPNGDVVFSSQPVSSLYQTFGLAMQAVVSPFTSAASSSGLAGSANIPVTDGISVFTAEGLVVLSRGNNAVMAANYAPPLTPPPPR